MKRALRLKPRHDYIAFLRQGSLARFLLSLDLIVVVCSVLIGHLRHWQPFTARRFAILLSVGSFSVICLILAAGAIAGLRRVWDDVNAMGAVNAMPQSKDFIDSHRMIFYYLGVILNITAFAIAAEETGGLLTSPYTSPMVALILTGQQLSRFKTQSSWLISAGCIVAGLMWIYESTAGLVPAPPAPRALGFTLLAISLAAAGAITNAEKDHNYLIESKQRLPTHANVYRAADGTWHYVIYSRRYRLDPIVGVSGVETGVEGQADTLGFVRAKIEAEVSSMYQAANWGAPKFQWPSEIANSFAVHFPANEAGRRTDTTSTRTDESSRGQ